MGELIFKIAICILAGLGAGLGTGFAGLSAAAVISPMLITFLQMDAFMAVGIALASDVLASAISAYTYYRHKNVDIKNGLLMMVCIVVMTVAGSFAANFIPENLMGHASTIVTAILGLKFIIRPITATKETMATVSRKKKIFQSILFGIYIGFICGFVGAGGGMMMLLVLTCVMHFELKTAVGTSVFIMTFTALTGSVSHFLIGGTPDWLCLGVCMISTLAFALVASKIANRAKPISLNRIVGILLVALALLILIFEIFVH